MNYEEWEKSTSDQRAAYCDLIAREAYAHCCSILIGCMSQPVEKVANGTGVLIALEGRFYVLTAYHVVRNLKERHDRGEPAHLQIGMVNVNLQRRMVYYDADLDIALLAVHLCELPKLGKRPYFPMGDFPPALPREGSHVMLSGFAAYNRENGHGGSITNTSIHFSGRVVNPRENQFYVIIDREGVATDKASLMPPEGACFGGMSGGPVMLFKEGKLPIVGIISEQVPWIDGIRVCSLGGLRHAAIPAIHANRNTHKSK